MNFVELGKALDVRHAVNFTAQAFDSMVLLVTEGFGGTSTEGFVLLPMNVGHASDVTQFLGNSRCHQRNRQTRRQNLNKRDV
ncbi:hypothetical protein VPH35_074389 [Triticum aestivum]